MTPDFTKPGASALFEAFGFGAVFTAITALYFRDRIVMTLGVQDSLTEVPNWLGLILASVAIFSMFTIGRGLIAIGELLSGGKNSKVADVRLKQYCANHTNPKAWDQYLRLQERLRFLNGCFATSAWISAVLMLFTLRHWIETKGVEPFYILGIIFFAALAFGIYLAISAETLGAKYFVERLNTAYASMSTSSAEDE